MKIDEIARDAEEYAKKQLYTLFGNDVETERKE